MACVVEGYIISLDSKEFRLKALLLIVELDATLLTFNNRVENIFVLW